MPIRHGLLWLSRGNLYIQDGTLRFTAAGNDDIEPGDYAIPFQTISMILLGPGTTITHDVLRILASQGTLIAAIRGGWCEVLHCPTYGNRPFRGCASTCTALG